mmetsp:Transcript_20797/g.48628  ORF Transcript_20797/g.48628 Transcript_20797/m.48628 type:complete len:567 (+) Transcript_20797:69-1769(+)
MAPRDLKRTSTVVVDQAREAAVEKVTCPICFEALSDYPDQVGALTFEGHRVEAALYHSSCVLSSSTGKLVFQTETGHAVSPLTRELVDGFHLMPSLTKAKEWAAFVNWENGPLDIKKVTSAVAALLPVDECDARRFVLMEIGLPEDQPDDSEIKQKEVVDALLPAVRRQLRRLVGEAPRQNAPELCRNSTQDELKQWFQFWDTKSSGVLDHTTLHFAVVTAFHTALAKTADATTKAAVANSFFAEIGLRECEEVNMAQFLEKLAPQLLANLPVAYGRGWPSGEPLDPKQPLTLKLREMRSGAERPIRFPEAGEVLVGDLRQATHRRFPVMLARNEVKLFVMGQQLECDAEPLFAIRGIYDGATVTFMPGKRRVESKEPSRCNTISKRASRHSRGGHVPELDLSDLDDLDLGDLETDDELDQEEPHSFPVAEVSPRASGTGTCCSSNFSRQISPESTCSKQSTRSCPQASTNHFVRQASLDSKGTVMSRQLSKISAQSCPGQGSSQPNVCRRKSITMRVKETMPRVSKRCPLLLDDWSPGTDWALPRNMEKAKIPKSPPCQFLTVAA